MVAWHFEVATNPEQGYVMVMRDFLPPAFRGLMVAAFLAAFMSTVGTQLNWGSSYLVNDLYKRFINPAASDSQVVTVARGASAVGAIAAVFVAMQSRTVVDALAAIAGGIVAVLAVQFLNGGKPIGLITPAMCGLAAAAGAFAIAGLLTRSSE